ESECRRSSARTSSLWNSYARCSSVAHRLLTRPPPIVRRGTHDQQPSRCDRKAALMEPHVPHNLPCSKCDATRHDVLTFSKSTSVWSCYLRCVEWGQAWRFP